MFLTTCLLLLAMSCNATLVAATTGADDNNLRRDLGSIQASLGSVNTALAGLDSSILSYPASPKVLLSSMAVLQTIQQATASINASQALSLADTANLKATTDSLVSNVNVTITDLIGQKELFDLLNLNKVVLIQVQNIQGAALALASTLASKVDPAASNIAVDGINALTAALQRGVAVFNGSSSAPAPAMPPAPAAPAPAAPPSVASSSVAAPSAAPQAVPSPSNTPAPISPLSNPPPPDPSAGTIGPGPFAMMMPIPGTFEAGKTCICMCPPVTACPSS
ncbi:hypothetical protein Daus18300_001019 [Diaporthe australafricana]|uniref:Cell wall protein n=1 Tax=Diaporthe australafricana TaxID=127596 RepID=A0ABR3XYS9_9PEZI